MASTAMINSPHGAQSARKAASDHSIKLSARRLWKVFGRDASEFLAKAGPEPDAASFAAAGLVGAVRDVSLDINEGEIFIVMGLSGSGKSTLLRCLSRLIEPTSGEVILEGRDLLKAPEAELIELRRHKMGMVFQHFALLPHLTVIENVAFPLAVQKVAKPQRLTRAREMIELVGLAGKETAFPRELSGGQQQRVGIARSLAVGPELWFLDEPFSALDPLIRREMQAELQRLQSVLHKTIIFVTHDFEEAIKLADRIAIMKDGQIIQTGTPEDLVTRPATDYVAEFTRDVQRAKVVSVGSRMAAPKPGIDAARSLAASAKVGSVAAEVLAAGRDFAVTDETRKVVGSIGPEQVIDVLVERPSEGRPR
jgi:glycine betaine/proline transport system ATP-binding protein